jgi:hypothetical protein
MEKLLDIEKKFIENLFKPKQEIIREFGCILGIIGKLSE